MGTELREARGSGSAAGGDPEHSSPMSTLPSLASSEMSGEQPWLLGSASAKVSMFAQRAPGRCRVQLAPAAKGMGL